MVDTSQVPHDVTTEQDDMDEVKEDEMEKAEETGLYSMTNSSLRSLIKTVLGDVHSYRVVFLREDG